MKSKVDIKRSIIMALGVFFTFIFGSVCPPWGTVSQIGVKVLGVLIGWLLFCITDMGLAAASIISLAGMYCTGYCNVSEITAATLGNTMILQIILIFCLCYAFTKSGAAEVIVRWVLSRKFIVGKPMLFTFMFVAALGIMGIVSGQFSIILITIALLQNISQITGLDVKGNWTKSVLIFMVILSGASGSFLYFLAFPAMLRGMFDNSLATIGASVSFAGYMVTVLLIMVFLIAFFMVYASKFLKKDMEKLVGCNVEELQPDEFKKMKVDQIVITVTLFVSCVYPFLIKVFPEAIYNYLNGFGQILFMCVAVGFLCMVRVDNKPLLVVRDAMSNGVSWDVVFATASVLLIAGGLSSEASGFTKWILGMCASFMSSIGIIPVIIIVSILTVFITQFFSNTATCVIMSTVLAPLSIVFFQNGNNVSVFPAMIICGGLSACLIPAGSSQAALMLGSAIFENDIGWTMKKGWFFVAMTMLSCALSGIVVSFVM